MNPFDVLKNAKAIQEQLAHIQDELSEILVTGSAGGGIVTISMNAKFDLVNIHIDPIAVDSRDVPMLQDLIIAAHSNASEKVKELLKTKLGPIAGGFSGL